MLRAQKSRGDLAHPIAQAQHVAVGCLTMRLVAHKRATKPVGEREGSDGLQSPFKVLASQGGAEISGNHLIIERRMTPITAPMMPIRRSRLRAASA